MDRLINLLNTYQVNVLAIAFKGSYPYASHLYFQIGSPYPNNLFELALVHFAV